MCCNFTTISHLWHNRLGHLAIKVVDNVLSLCNSSNANKEILDFYKACCRGKHHKCRFFLSTSIYTKPLEPIHNDLWGPSLVLSSSGYKYYMHFTDYLSRYTWVYLLRNKSEALHNFTNFKKQVEMQLRVPISY